jgi:hypothetical protein
MTLIVLATICLLACAFYVYVLIHWSRDTKRKTTTHSAAENQADEDGERRRPYVVGSGGLQAEMAALRPGQCGLPVWQSGRAVAGLVVMSPSGKCTK